MTRRFFRVCADPRCKTLTREARCDQHSEAHRIKIEHRRESPDKRGYDHDWKRFRKSYLLSNPLCKECGKPANEPHHIIPLSDRPDLKYAPENLQSLCKGCHSRTTARERQRPGGRKNRVGVEAGVPQPSRGRVGLNL